ncbi:hypothetical protein HDU79_008552 [Rhizoclosmatium sp. JEL0117]|nr:hypothetical protein HDU79_008552 [Rhizoclosmatium sp. JEL0117]
MYNAFLTIYLLALSVKGQSYDLALGAHISASSTYLSGPCNIYSCGPNQVLSTIPGSIIDIGQWVSNPSQCDADWRTAGTGNLDSAGRLNASLKIDWSENYGTQLISEVRFRYGTVAGNPWSVQLVIFSQTPLNTFPIATPIKNAADWYAFTFETPVTASGIQLTWFGLQSRDGGQSCFASISNVEAWTGLPPDPIVDNGSQNTTISVAVLVSMIVIPIVSILMCAAVVFWFIAHRRKNLAARFTNLTVLHDINLRRRQQQQESRVERLVDEEEDEQAEQPTTSATYPPTNVWNTSK